jgi:hypothetical protein
MLFRKIAKGKAINFAFLLLLMAGIGLIFQAVRISRVNAFTGCFPNQFCFGLGNDCRFDFRETIFSVSGVYLLLAVVISVAGFVRGLTPAPARHFFHLVSSMSACQKSFVHQVR